MAAESWGARSPAGCSFLPGVLARRESSANRQHLPGGLRIGETRWVHNEQDVFLLEGILRWLHQNDTVII
jgi:hypothetical protein